MGHRITWRSRPRNGYPWTMPTKRLPNAEISSGGFPYYGYLGPLSMAAVIELVYRARKMTWAASVDYTFDGDPATSTGGGELVLNAFYGDPVLSELEVFNKILRETEAPAFTGDGGTLLPTDFLQSVSRSAAVEINGDGFPVIEEVDGSGVPTGDFYLTTLFMFELNLTGPTYMGVGNYPAGSADYEQGLFGSLVLQCGTFPLQMIAEGNGDAEDPHDSTFTLTATEWHPYATTAGAAAWDTATGAAANGGPGA